MQVDLELYRKDVRLPGTPPCRLSVIDIAPEQAERRLVFVHGFGGWASQWRYQLQHFSTSNRVIAADLRGHGQSDKPISGYDIQRLVKDLEETLTRLGVHQKITLIGHSFGGAIATEYANAHAEEVERLVLIATAGEYKLNPLFRALLRLPSNLLRLFYPFTRHWLGAPPHVLKAFYTQTLCTWNGWNLFRSLKVPTLVIRGHLDVVFERPFYEEVTRAIPIVEEVDVGASGHMVMLERRQAVNRAITRFLESEKRYWAHSSLDTTAKQQSLLLQQRPWLPYYDDGVPSTIAVPQVPLHQLLRSAARRFPRRTALIFEGNRISYQRLNQEVNRFANLLRSLGLEKGDRVMLVLPNAPQMVIAFYGTLKAGGVAVFTLPTQEADELIQQIYDSGASYLVTLAQFDQLIQKIRSNLEPSGRSPLKHVIFTQISDYLPLHKRALFRLKSSNHAKSTAKIVLDARTHSLMRMLYTHSKQAPEVELLASDLAAIIYTGGTTAEPKGVMLTHYNLVANTLQTRHWMPDAKEGEERFLCVLPFSHSYGLTAGLNVPIALGATLILKPRFEVADILRSIQKYRPTIFPGVPQMYVAIKDYPGVRRFGIQSIKACISGSAPLPVEVQEAFEKLTRGRLVEGYGLTEASPVTHANPLYGLRKVGSIGIPLPSTEARIVDLRSGREEVEVGQIGELAVRGPQVMLGYWQNPKATKKVLSSDGWLLSGDVALRDEDGYFRIIARKADMWYPKKPGKPAFPRDVEEVLYEVPQVKEVAVVAIAGQPVAFVILGREKTSAESLIEYCKRRLPPELVPKLVFFVDDFPRTFIGKILRRELAKRFDESHA